MFFSVIPSLFSLPFIVMLSPFYFLNPQSVPYMVTPNNEALLDHLLSEELMIMLHASL